MAWLEEWDPFGSPHKTSGKYKHWRDERKWPDNMDPAQRAFMAHMKKVLPNTKYGNELAPWLFRQYKEGRIQPGGDAAANINDWIKSHRRIQELRGRGVEPGPQNRDTRRLEELEYLMEGGYPDEVTGGYWGDDTQWSYELHGWPRSQSGEEYGLRHGSLAETVPSIIDAMKSYKRRGKELNPMSFMEPRNLSTAIEQDENQRMKNSGKVVHQFDNGWSIRQLRNPQEAQWEGRRMDNCIGDYDPRGRTIYSLRDRENRPHVTYEMKAPRREREYPRLQSVYGKGNSDPKPQYKAALKEFHDSLPLDKRPRGGDEYDLPPRTDWTQLDDSVQSDELGQVTEPRHQWNDIIKSLWNKDASGRPRTPSFNPEAIQHTLQYAQRPGADSYALADAVRDHVRDLNGTLATLKEEQNPAYQQTLDGPWAHTLKALQEGFGADAGTGRSNLLQHYSAWSETRPHIGANGKYCECAWGNHRPAWDPEWKHHTNWDEDFTPLNAPLA